MESAEKYSVVEKNKTKKHKNTQKQTNKQTPQLQLLQNMTYLRNLCEHMSQRDVVYTIIPLLFLQESSLDHHWQYVPQKMLFSF